ncbi:MAG: c-type cytochrome [Gammaproteobacteria bacterium]|nr:c-type cytochrome [Gammaproteobacteria bacterium]
MSAIITLFYRMDLAFFVILTLLSGGVQAYDYLQPLPSQPQIPADNPQSKAKIALGKQLFFDTRLSKDGTLSCNSCHNLAAGGDDDGSVGKISQGKLKRSAPGLWNVGHMSVYYWDSRATSLETQAADHILDPAVMGMSSEEALIARFSAIPGYAKEFSNAFSGSKALNLKNIARAIASFERTLNTPDSRFDQYIQGKESILTKQEKRGIQLFNDVGCLACHFGGNFAGPAPGPALKMGDGFYELFPNHMGSHYDKKYDLVADLGLYHITLNPADKRLWRVPSMRNIVLTAPYFHNGSVASLEEAVRVMAKTQLQKELDEKEVMDIVAFLKTLTGEIPEITLPQLPDTEGLSLLTKN